MNVLTGRLIKRARAVHPADMEIVLKRKNLRGRAKTESAGMYAKKLRSAAAPLPISKTIERGAITMMSIGMTQQARYRKFIKIARILFAIMENALDITQMNIANQNLPAEMILAIAKKMP